MIDTELLAAIRTIVREELVAALKTIPSSIPQPEPSRAGFDLRAVALIMGMDIYPRDYRELIDNYKMSGRLPVSIKESWQRFEDWKAIPNGNYAASFSHRAYLDSLADKRNKLKAEGKWLTSKKKKPDLQ